MPISLSSEEARFASSKEDTSGRETKIRVVFSGLERDSTAFAYNSFFSPRPDSGPKQEAPCVLSSKNPLHAVGNCNRRSVCPVGAVSNNT